MRAFDSKRGLTLAQRFGVPRVLGRPSAGSDDEEAVLAGSRARAGRTSGLGVSLSLGLAPYRNRLFGRRGRGAAEGPDSDEREDLLETNRKISKRLKRGFFRDLGRAGKKGEEAELDAVRELAQMDLELELGLDSGEDSPPRRQTKGRRGKGSRRRDRQGEESGDSGLDLVFFSRIAQAAKSGAGGGGAASRTAPQAPKQSRTAVPAPPRAPPRPLQLPAAPAPPDLAGLASPATAGAGASGSWEARTWKVEGPAAESRAGARPQPPQRSGASKWLRTPLGVPDFVGYALHIARSNEARTGRGGESSADEKSDAWGSASSDAAEDGPKAPAGCWVAPAAGAVGLVRGSSCSSHRGDKDRDGDAVVWARYAKGGCGSSASETEASRDSLADEGLQESLLLDLFHKPVADKAYDTL